MQNESVQNTNIIINCIVKTANLFYETFLTLAKKRSGSALCCQYLHRYSPLFWFIIMHKDKYNIGLTSSLLDCILEYIVKVKYRVFSTLEKYFCLKN